MWTPPGPAVDAKGYLYQSVGNGASGVGDPYDFSDSVLKFDGFGHLVDSFSPSTWAADNDADKDLGSQGATLVGSSWVFIAGKSGTAYVLKQSSLGGIGTQVSSAALCQSFGGTAVVGSTIYVPCTDGVRAVTIDSTGHLHVKWHAASNINGSPVVGGGRVWSLDVSAGKLYGLNPSTGAVQNSATVGSVNRFATPALYGHLVYVPTLSGYTVVESV
jgi:outer membrane protein assembly factor BamB